MSELVGYEPNWTATLAPDLTVAVDRGCIVLVAGVSKPGAPSRLVAIGNVDSLISVLSRARDHRDRLEKQAKGV